MPRCFLPPPAEWIPDCAMRAFSAIGDPLECRSRAGFGEGGCGREQRSERQHLRAMTPQAELPPHDDWMLNCVVGVLNATGDPLEQGSGCFRSRSSPGPVCRPSAGPAGLRRDSSVRCLALRGVSAQMGIHSARGSGLGRSRRHGGAVVFWGCGVVSRCGAALVLAVR